MGPKKTIFISLIILLWLASCGTSTKQDNAPNMSFVMEFGIDSTQLLYQYYQKFGFTDVCEDLRMVAKLNESPKLGKNLPINDEDLKTINNFSNKVDRIESSTISFKSNPRSQFYDIELNFIEFVTDSTLTVKLKTGEYEITQTESTSTLKVFDSDSKLLYIEIHKCDEE